MGKSLGARFFMAHCVQLLIYCALCSVSQDLHSKVHNKSFGLNVILVMLYDIVLCLIIRG